MTDFSSPPIDRDLQKTLRNRTTLQTNANRLFWYEQLYARVFAPVEDLANKSVLEVGSGTSPLKLFYPQVVTSDVLELDYLDHIFDCHLIDQYDGIPDRSVDIVTMTNVIHHLKDPLAFLQRTQSKLRPNGEVIMVEPYFSALSLPIYKLLHHEPTDFSIQRPLLDVARGPLSSSNQAIPHMLFVSRPDWLEELSAVYDTANIGFDYFSSLSYFATGGISRASPLPAALYRALFRMDQALVDTAPRLFASFFIVRMKVRGNE